MAVPDDDWNLWLDTEAGWREDAIHLPGEFALSDLPVNAPTGGWQELDRVEASLRGQSRRDAVSLSLPATAEQFFWGRFGHHSYSDNTYVYEKKDAVPQDGAYLGVSWWFRNIDLPQAWRRKRLLLHVRGARLRAEVYLNGRLTGYSILDELPFTCDLTQAARFGPGSANQLAIRITNPGGRYDWSDGNETPWGKVHFYMGHGFGGLDRGLTVSAHDGVRVQDCWVLNTPDPRQVHCRIQTENDGTEAVGGSLHCAVVDPGSGRRFFEKALSVSAPVGISSAFELEVACPDANLWSLERPALYRFETTWRGDDGSSDTRSVEFGFRSFGPEGVGQNALFRLNGERIRLYSAISWGFWALNGLWPTPELATREVEQARALGLNCLNFHRNVGHEQVLVEHDRLGVLRYMEPGGGKYAARLPGHNDEADQFSQRYMVAKILHMVRAYRSHPSLIQWTLQNEVGGYSMKVDNAADLGDPDVRSILRAIHREDPSRSVVLNDGFVANGKPQAWLAPWSETLRTSADVPFANWWNQHQGAADHWYDAFYRSPREFTYRVEDKAHIVEWGEMEGVAVPDDHGLMLQQIERHGGQSYDKQDHEEILAAYEHFLDRWGFRGAYPTTSDLFQSIGRTSYASWGQYLENVRIADDVDFAVISGWESTAIENHSGIVDNFRDFKSDPALIRDSLLPVRPLAKQRALVVAAGDTAVFDLYLLNDTGRAVSGALEFVHIDPAGHRSVLASLAAPEQTRDRFSYLLREAVMSARLQSAGLHRFEFSLSSLPQATHVQELLVVDVSPSGVRSLQIGVEGVPQALRSKLEKIPHVQVTDFAAGGRYDVLVTAGLSGSALSNEQIGDLYGDEGPASVASKPKASVPKVRGTVSPALLRVAQEGTALLVIAQRDELADGIALQLQAAGAFSYRGQVGDFRAPWMGNWYFGRTHATFDGLPQGQAMGLYFQIPGDYSNGLLVEGRGVEVITGYSRDHDRQIGAGTFTAPLGKGRLLFQRIPDMHPVVQQRWLANAVRYLAG